jgi:hypothetical protein
MQAALLSVIQLQVANDVQQFAQIGHTLDKILLHRHNQIPPKCKVVWDRGLLTVLRPLIEQILFAVNYSPMTARISPMVCIPRIRFFFMDIFKFLLKAKLYWAWVFVL